MQNSNRKFFKYASSIFILLILLLPHSRAKEIPSRYFYDNQENNSDLPIDNETTYNESDSSAANSNLLCEGNSEAIPLEFYLKLDNVTDIEEFVEFVVQKENTDPEHGITGKHIKRNVERAAVRRPVSANCSPQKTIVSLEPREPSTNPNVYYFPTCTHVKRCGGCCSSALMSCQPTEKEYVNFIILKNVYGASGPPEEEIVVVEEHTRCRCNCRIKEQDCNPYQIYRPDKCKCECKNSESREKCQSQTHKIWDEQNCRCSCHDTELCTTGTVFDESECKCIVPDDTAIGPTLNQRRRLIVKATPVDADNTTIYDVV